MSDNGIKYDEEKSRLDLVPSRALMEIGKVLGFGAKKYAPNNWKKVKEARRRYFAAAERHMLDYKFGKTNDDGEGGSGLHHLAHACVSLMFILALDLGLDTTDEEWYEEDDETEGEENTPPVADEEGASFLPIRNLTPVVCSGFWVIHRSSVEAYPESDKELFDRELFTSQGSTGMTIKEFIDRGHARLIPSYRSLGVGTYESTFYAKSPWGGGHSAIFLSSDFFETETETATETETETETEIIPWDKVLDYHVYVQRRASEAPGAMDLGRYVSSDSHEYLYRLVSCGPVRIKKRPGTGILDLFKDDQWERSREEFINVGCIKPLMSDLVCVFMEEVTEPVMLPIWAPMGVRSAQFGVMPPKGETSGTFPVDECRWVKVNVPSPEFYTEHWYGMNAEDFSWSKVNAPEPFTLTDEEFLSTTFVVHRVADPDDFPAWDEVYRSVSHCLERPMGNVDSWFAMEDEAVSWEPGDTINKLNELRIGSIWQDPESPKGLATELYFEKENHGYRVYIEEPKVHKRLHEFRLTAHPVDLENIPEVVRNLIEK